VFVVHQLDGTLAHIPCWMMSEAAAHHELRSEPRLPLEHLRDLRIEVDSLLESLIDRFVEQLDQVFMLRVFHVDTIW
jgi:hypothetical protein